MSEQTKERLVMHRDANALAERRRYPIDCKAFVTQMTQNFGEDSLP